MKERKFNRQNAPTKGIKQSFNEEYSEQVDYEDKIPEGMTEEDVMQLMLRNEEMKAEQEIIRKKVFKTIGATEGWTQEEN